MEALPASVLDPHRAAEIIRLAEEVDRIATAVVHSAPAPDRASMYELDVARHAWRKATGSLMSEARDAVRRTFDAMASRHGAAPRLVPAPDIDRIAFPGAGAKGQAYGGALAFIGATGTLGRVRRVSGVSFGSIVAAAVACGIGGAGIERRLRATHMPGLFRRDRAGYARLARRTATPFALAASAVRGRLGLFSGERLVTEMDTWLRRAITVRLNALPAHRRDPQVESVAAALRGGRPLTFRMIGILVEAKVPGLKSLVITAFDRMTGQLVAFDSDDRHSRFADVPVAVAIRASAGLPVVFTPVALQVGARRLKLVDAGVAARVPLEELDGPGMTLHPWRHRSRTGSTATAARATGADPDRASTLVIDFERRGEGHAELHSPGYAKSARSSPLLRWLAGNPRLSEALLQDIRRLRSMGPNVMMLSHGEMTGASFWASGQAVLVAQLEGELAAARHLALRSDQAIDARDLHQPDATAPAGRPETRASTARRG